jgi:hypothetical protein
VPDVGHNTLDDRCRGNPEAIVRCLPTEIVGGGRFRCGDHFQFHGGLAFKGHAAAQADQGGNAVEKPAHAGGQGGVERLLHHGHQNIGLLRVDGWPRKENPDRESFRQKPDINN